MEECRFSTGIELLERPVGNQRSGLRVSSSYGRVAGGAEPVTVAASCVLVPKYLL